MAITIAATMEIHAPVRVASVRSLQRTRIRCSNICKFHFQMRSTDSPLLFSGSIRKVTAVSRYTAEALTTYRCVHMYLGIFL